MLRLSFKLSGSDRLYISPKWICNGHWMLKREAAFHPHHREISKAFKPIQNHADGCYLQGYKAPASGTDFPAFEQVIPPKDGAKPAKLTGQAKVSEMLDVIGLQYKADDGTEAWIAPEYAPLLALGEVWIIDKHKPVRIENAGELVGVVMPVRVEVAS